MCELADPNLVVIPPMCVVCLREMAALRDLLDASVKAVTSIARQVGHTLNDDLKYYETVLAGLPLEVKEYVHLDDVAETIRTQQTLHFRANPDELSDRSGPVNLDRLATDVVARLRGEVANG